MSLSAVFIEWEANNVTLSENVGRTTPRAGVADSLCASIINPGINDSRQEVQIQVITENFTAEGSQSKQYYDNLLCYKFIL